MGESLSVFKEGGPDLAHAIQYRAYGREMAAAMRA